ncbi:MAG: ATP-binding protein [Clostridia bacterium]|nr:ATP-binding protein [Clostridia bacterium]
MQLINYKIEAYIKFQPDSIEKMLFLCEEAAESITMDKSARFKLKCAIHELVANSVEHGYSKGCGLVSVTLRKLDDSIYFEVCDQGSSLNLSDLDLEKDIDSISEATPRGWGLRMIKKLSRDFTISNNSPKGTKISLHIPLSI